jgi:hypothetical protein
MANGEWRSAIIYRANCKSGRTFCQPFATPDLQADASWRGAEPLGERLDERHTPGVPPEPAILIAADGSQIYPDRHGIALYYLLNVGRRRDSSSGLC